MKKKNGQRIAHPSKTFSSIAVAELMKIASTLAHGRKKKQSND
jgi:hypothetical protein